MSYEMVDHQRAKTTLVNKGLLPSLIFCVCVWLLYQARHSSYSRNDYLGRIETHLCGNNVYVYIGRKELGEWLIDKVLCDSEDDSTKEDEGIGFGNDESNENKKNKNQVASLHDETGYVLEKYQSDEDKNVENEPGITHLKEFPNSREKNLDSENSDQVQVHLHLETAEPDKTEKGNEEGYHNMSTPKDSEQWDLDDQQIIEKTKFDTLKMENGEANDQKTDAKESIIQESSRRMDLNETGHKFQAFHDENGIHDISEWTTTLEDTKVDEETNSYPTFED